MQSLVLSWQIANFVRSLERKNYFYVIHIYSFKNKFTRQWAPGYIGSAIIKALFTVKAEREHRRPPWIMCAKQRKDGTKLPAPKVIQSKLKASLDMSKFIARYSIPPCFLVIIFLKHPIAYFMTISAYLLIDSDTCT